MERLWKALHHRSWTKPLTRQRAPATLLMRWLARSHFVSCTLSPI